MLKRKIAGSHKWEVACSIQHMNSGALVGAPSKILLFSLNAVNDDGDGTAGKYTLRLTIS